MGIDAILTVGLLPVVVLTFAAEGFAKTLYKEDIKSASWRAFTTIVATVNIKSILTIQ